MDEKKGIKERKNEDLRQAVRYLREIDKLRDTLSILVSIREVKGTNLDLF
jgi:hypothetical protein